MKVVYNFFFVSLFLCSSFAFSGDLSNTAVQDSRVQELKGKLSSKYRELLSSLKRVAPNSVSILNDRRNGLMDIMRRNGIYNLVQDLGRMRLEACRVQQSSELAMLYDKIIVLQNQIEDKTVDEQAKIEALVAQNIKQDDSRFKEYNDQIEDLNDQIKLKAKDELAEIVRLNDQILNHPINKDLIKRVKDSRLLAKIKIRFKAIQDQIKPLDEAISRELSNINRLDDDGSIKKLRMEIRKIKKEIMKYDPCLEARESLKNRGVLEYFVY